MGTREQFTDAEWSGVIQAPVLAGVAVTAADPGGLWAAIKEGAAMARAVGDAQQAAASGSLLGEIGKAYDTSDGRGVAQNGVKDLLRGKKPAEAATAATKRVGEIAAMVAAKAPSEAPAFKTFLRATAQGVAEAAKEGGFLGFGGEQVSESEKKTLADLDRVLG